MTLNFDSDVLRPTDMIVIDSILMIVEPSEDKLFSLFSLKNKKGVGSRINKGQGPNDMLRPRFLGYKNNIIKIMDMATSTMFEYNITNSSFASC